MKRFAEDTKELTGGTNWWETLDRSLAPSIVDSAVIKRAPPLQAKKEVKSERKKERNESKDEKRKRKSYRADKKAHKKKHRHRKRSSSSSASSSDEESRVAKKQRLDMLRKERVERERAEQHRVAELLNPSAAQKPKSEPFKEPPPPDSSSRFHPELCRRR